MSTRPASASVVHFIDGQWVSAQEGWIPFTPVAGNTAPLHIAEGGSTVVESAVASATAAFQRTRTQPVHERVLRLNLLADTLDACGDELARGICSDVGKPIRLARGEVARGAQFVRGCIAAISQPHGEVLALDSVIQGSGRIGLTRRVPYGVVGAITPFNAPINLLVQKLAPALAAGNTVVAKPALASTRVAATLAHRLVERGMPPGMFNVVAGDRASAAALAAHPDVPVISFTGGVAAGEALSRLTGVRKFISELGSNAANIVLADADLKDAARKIAGAAFEASGQQCISAQRIIVERSVLPEFETLLLAATRQLRVGDAFDDQVDVGPMVTLAAAQRIAALCEDARARGARVVLPLRQEGALSYPAIYADPPPDARLWREEAFGPVAVLIAADDVEHAIALANDTPFGLQGAVFTHDLRHTFRVAEAFDVGSLWVNEASRFRLDMYPFGGMKLSGTGREGIQYAIDELSQQKFLGINPGLTA